MIEFESVSKTYRDGTTAVSGLSLQIPSDKITVIVGPSGCGKTTTLRMLNRMLEPSKGRILWDGKPLRSQRKTSLRRQMGYVIQNGGLFPHRTVVENVTTVPSLLGWDRGKARKRALELLKAVGLDTKLNNRYPAQLSGGQQQRVGVARALAADPIVLLMDEPFSAVDPVVRNDLHDLLLGLQGELGKTVVMITHDIDEAIKLGDQVAILRIGGRLAQFGKPQELLDDPADDFVEGFVGKDRGYRALSFAPASGLGLDRTKVVRDAGSPAGDEPVLVVDSEAKPIGWIDKNRPGQMLQLGSTFDPETDTMRVALDSALTSPVGLAVAVSRDTGRYSGTVTASAILAAVTESRADIADEISGRQQIDLDHAQPADADGRDAANADHLAAADASATRTGASALVPPGSESAESDSTPVDAAGAEDSPGSTQSQEQAQMSEQQNDQVENMPDTTVQSAADSDESSQDPSGSVQAPVEQSAGEAAQVGDDSEGAAEELLRSPDEANANGSDVVAGESRDGDQS